MFKKETVIITLDGNDMPKGFKMTELGPLPQEWRVVRLGELVEKHLLLIRGGFPQGQHNEAGNGVPHLRPFNITNDGSLDLSQIKYIAPPSEDDPHWLLPNDVIFNNTNSEELVGKTALFDRNGRFVLSNHMTLLRILEPNQVDAYWLSRQLHYFWYLGLYKSLCRRHVNQASISLERLKGIPIPLPPLDEQRAISHVLRTVQRAKEATEQVIAALKEFKKSLMRHLFTYGPVPIEQADKVELKDTEIGTTPAHWEVVRLGELFEIQQGKALSSKARAGLRKRPFLRTANVLWGQIDLSILDQMHFDEEEEARLALIPGDLLVCEGGDIGRTAIWEGQMPLVLYQNHLHRLRAARDGVEPFFYMYWMQAAWTLLFLYTGAGNKTTIPNLSRGRLAALDVPLAPYDEQKKIAEILIKLDNKIKAEENKKSALETLFKTLLHNLMTGKIRVANVE